MRVGASEKAKDPFAVALDALRGQLANGRLVSGEPLTITEIAHELGLSATPVREALSRLAGERLLEDRRGRGYFAPRIDVADLAELYNLRRLYIAEALQKSQGLGEAERGADGFSPPTSFAERLVQKMNWVVAASGSRALFDAYRQVADRLAPAVRVEAQVFALEAELAELNAVASDRESLAEMFLALHARRCVKADILVRAMRAEVNIASL